MHSRRQPSPSLHDAPVISGASGEAFEQSASGVLLVGFVVWAGEVIGGLRPIFEGVSESGELSGERYWGALIGADRGAHLLLLRPGRAVSAIAYEGWTVDGHAALRALQLVWRPVSRGAPGGPAEVSDPVASYRAPGLRRRGLFQGNFYLDTPVNRGIGGLHGAVSIHLNMLGLLTVHSIDPAVPRSRWLTPAPGAALERWL
jgi:hypothetical protein